MGAPAVSFHSAPMGDESRSAHFLRRLYLHSVRGARRQWSLAWMGPAYNASTLQQAGVICLSPNGFGNGIWAPGGLPIDTVSPNGRLFLSAGNGSYSSYPPLSSNVNFGNSIVRLDLVGDGTFTPGSAFTPFNQATLTNGDSDQGAGGVLILPDQP